MWNLAPYGALASAIDEADTGSRYRSRVEERQISGLKRVSFTDSWCFLHGIRLSSKARHVHLKKKWVIVTVGIFLVVTLYPLNGKNPLSSFWQLPLGITLNRPTITIHTSYFSDGWGPLPSLPTGGQWSRPASSPKRWHRSPSATSSASPSRALATKVWPFITSQMRGKKGTWIFDIYPKWTPLSTKPVL